MEPSVQELGLWDRLPALLIDGGAGDPVRPPVHIQAAAAGCLRLVGPDGPLMWGLVESGSYGIEFVRATNAAIQAVPPIRVEDMEHAPASAGSPEFLGWWTRHFAALLCTSASTPLAQGRRYLFAPMGSVESAPPGLTSHEWHQRKWERLILRSDRLDELLSQRHEFELRWDIGYVGLLLTRQLSDETDGRVKMWRKRAREGRLPPLVVWWCRGLYAHVLLDGHDRVHAALLENISPEIVVLADVSPHSKDDVEERRERVLNEAALLDEIPSVTGRAFATNTVLRAGWDPRAEWDLATPGFPLDGGVQQWAQEVRGTSLEEALSRRRELEKRSRES